MLSQKKDVAEFIKCAIVGWCAYENMFLGYIKELCCVGHLCVGDVSSKDGVPNKGHASASGTSSFTSTQAGGHVSPIAAGEQRGKC